MACFFFFLRGGIYTEGREVGCLCFLDIFHLTHSVSWSLVRGADSEARCICGISREGYEFGVRYSQFLFWLTGSDALTHIFRD